MKLKNKITFISILYFTICFFNNDANSKENFFDEAKNLYEKKKHLD